MGAFANQRLLGNKAFVKKLITTEPSTAEKLIAKIREIREDLKVRKNPEAKAQLELVRKAEKLFMQGLSEAGGTIDATGKIHIANKEDDEGEIKRLANPKSVENLTEEQVYKEGHIKLSAKAVNAVLACVMDQNAAAAVAAMPVAAGVPYVAGTAAAPAVTMSTAAAVSDKVPVVNTDEEVDPNDPIAQMIMGSDDPISSFLSYIGPVPEEEETN